MGSQNFLRDLDFGRAGEGLVKDILIERGFAIEWVNEKGFDLRDNSTWQKIEIKSDKWALKTGNFVCELWSHRENLSTGWLQHSNCEVLVYVLFDKETYSPRLIQFYNFLALKNFIFWSVLGGDWLTTEPTMGRIVAAKQNHNDNVRNLLIPMSDVKDYMYEEIDLKNKGAVD